MNHHYGLVFPHHTNGEPKENPRTKGENVPANNIETGQPIANDLDACPDPFAGIDHWPPKAGDGFSGCHVAEQCGFSGRLSPVQDSHPLPIVQRVCGISLARGSD